MTPFGHRWEARRSGCAHWASTWLRPDSPLEQLGPLPDLVVEVIVTEIVKGCCVADSDGLGGHLQELPRRIEFATRGCQCLRRPNGHPSRCTVATCRFATARIMESSCASGLLSW